MQYIIETAHDGMLLRTYLTQQLGLSHRLLSRLKTHPNGILLDGEHVTVRAMLHAGNVLTLALEDTPLSDQHHIVPGNALPAILYEDDDILMCNKPVDMPTHPSHGHFEDTLANAVARYEMETRGQIGVFRPINRLDRDTSGVVLIAKSQLAASRLSKAMQLGYIQKQYLAILDGVPSSSQGEIRAHIRRAQQSIITREICPPDAPGAQSAHTRYRVIAAWSTDTARCRCLVCARPVTGRTHQLRLHFAHLGTPIAGDSLYGSSDDVFAPAHQALHAYSLTFPHPTTGDIMTIIAPPGNEFCALLPSYASPP